MRNIHIFKTDKLTRLHGYAYGELGLSKKHLPWKEGRNIYITNDEEIKNGDWYLTSDHKTLKCKKVLMSIIYAEGDYGRNPNGCQKIILTTDQDLIKDGVQAIDDEFLEWFIKNPSCEEVEVKLTLNIIFGYQYKIIIPKELKQDPLEQAAKEYAEMHLDVSGKLGKYLVKAVFQDGAQWQIDYKIIIPKEELKQEVKDLAYWKNNAEEDYLKVPISVLRYITELEKTMYNEEWFNQFKK